MPPPTRPTMPSPLADCERDQAGLSAARTALPPCEWPAYAVRANRSRPSAVTGRDSRRLSSQDKNPADDAQERFIAITEAYEVRSSPCCWTAQTPPRSHPPLHPSARTRRPWLSCGTCRRNPLRCWGIPTSGGATTRAADRSADTAAAEAPPTASRGPTGCSRNRSAVSLSRAQLRCPSRTLTGRRAAPAALCPESLWRQWSPGASVSGTLVRDGRRVKITIHPDGSSDEEESDAAAGGRGGYSMVKRSGGQHGHSVHIEINDMGAFLQDMLPTWLAEAPLLGSLLLQARMCLRCPPHRRVTYRPPSSAAFALPP